MSLSPRGDLHTDVRAAFGIPGGGALFAVPRVLILAMDDRTEHRAADLLPEEVAAGSADPEAQAAAILADSEAREAGVEPALEHRTSAQTVDPDDTTR